MKIEVLLPKSMHLPRQRKNKNGNKNNSTIKNSNENENKDETKQNVDDCTRDETKRKLTLNQIDSLLEYERCKDNQIFFICVPPRHNPKLSPWTRRILLVTQDGRIYITSPLSRHYTLSNYLETSDKNNDEIIFGKENSADAMSDNEINNIITDIDASKSYKKSSLSYNDSINSQTNENSNDNSSPSNIDASKPQLARIPSRPEERLVKRSQSPHSPELAKKLPVSFRAYQNKMNREQSEESVNGKKQKSPKNDKNEKNQNQNQNENGSGGGNDKHLKISHARTAYSMDWDLHMRTSPKGDKNDQNKNNTSVNKIDENEADNSGIDSDNPFLSSTSFYSATILKKIERVEPICFQFFYSMTRFEETFSKITTIPSHFAHIPQFSEELSVVTFDTTLTSPLFFLFLFCFVFFVFFCFFFFVSCFCV